MALYSAIDGIELANETSIKKEKKNEKILILYFYCILKFKRDKSELHFGIHFYIFFKFCYIK